MEKTRTVSRSALVKAFLIAGLASLILLIPAGLAHGVRLTKSVKNKIKRNMSDLREKMRENPQATRQKARRAPAVVAVAPTQSNRATQGLAVQSAAKGCKAQATGTFFRNPTPPNDPNAIKASWANKSRCSGLPVLTLISTDMIEPNGTHHKSNGGPSVINPLNALTRGSADGPQGTWKMNNSVTWALSPPFVWGPGQGVCSGIGTPVATCFYPRVYPVLAP